MNSTYKKTLKNKTILITGGTGSFGNTVTSLLVNEKPKKIIIFSRDEKKQFDMRNKFDNYLIKFVIGDVRDQESIYKASENVDYIFHAAALKQVPTCEFFPIEAVKTNILGTHNVLSAAIERKVKRVVVLSTDKAVYPVNAMGISKAMMEKVMIAEARKYIDNGKAGTVVCGVRYGNVLYTRGSILPYFIELMHKNKKLPVTNSNMTRFLLPLIQAVNLVFYALVHGENGHIYVSQSSATTMGVLAEALCHIFNYEPGYYDAGVRAGEKMHETLINQEEGLRAINKKKYYQIPPESQGLDYNKYFFSGLKRNPGKIQAYTSENTYRLSLEETIFLLKGLPEIVSELKKWKTKKRKEI